MLAKMYKKVVPLSKSASLKVSKLKDYKHSKNITSTILTYDEVPQACKIYPIYFGQDVDGVVPMAILGIDESNMFLDSKNQWIAGKYIPAVFRAYPLGMAKTDEKSDKYTVIYDESYSGLNKKDGQEFSKDGKITDFGQSAVDFLQNLQGNLNKTQKALLVLEEYKLLKFADIDISIGDKKYKIANVGTIDEEALDALTDKQILNLVKTGVYNLISLQLLSVENLNYFVEKLSK